MQTIKDYLQAFFVALQFLTRIPVPRSFDCEGLAKKSLFFFPLTGWLIGGILYYAALLLFLSNRFGSLTSAVLIVILETFITGAFHLDGLSDSFDAFLSSGKNRDEKLAIMKDSRIGVMGAVAVVLSLILKISLLSEIIDSRSFFFIAAYPVMGRWSQLFLYATTPYVRKGGIGSLFARAAGTAVMISGFIWLLPLFFSPVSAAGLLAIIIFLGLYRIYACNQISGITGDVLGSATVITEIIFLILVAAF